MPAGAPIPLLHPTPSTQLGSCASPHTHQLRWRHSASRWPSPRPSPMSSPPGRCGRALGSAGRPPRAGDPVGPTLGTMHGARRRSPQPKAYPRPCRPAALTIAVRCSNAAGSALRARGREGAGRGESPPPLRRRRQPYPQPPPRYLGRPGPGPACPASPGPLDPRSCLPAPDRSWLPRTTSPRCPSRCCAPASMTPTGARGAAQPRGCLLAAVNLGCSQVSLEQQRGTHPLSTKHS